MSLVLLVRGFRTVATKTIADAKRIGQERDDIAAVLLRAPLEVWFSVPVVVASTTNDATIANLKLASIRKRGPNKKKAEDFLVVY